MDVKSARAKLVVSTFIFGTIGLLVRSIDMSSGGIACVRGAVGALFLVFWVKLRGGKFDSGAIKKNLALLLISGMCIGFNWILLFEAYRYTTVATATLCYYMAPIAVIAVSPLVFKEKVTLKKAICVAAALVGMVFVSGVADNGVPGAGEMKGILLGLAAAALYASIIMMNKKLRDIGAYDKTVVQLAAAAAVLVPYCIATKGFDLGGGTVSLVLLLVVCIVHTGFAYSLYFGSMDGLSSQTIAMISYIDPVVAVLLSTVVLKEPMTALNAVGAVMIIAAAMISEMPERKK